MSSYFRAIAIDFGGALTVDGPPSDGVLAAIDRVRAAGLKTVLVTGRILNELRDVFPAAERYFDAIVAENGAAMSLDGCLHTLSPPVESELDEALAGRGVPYRRGQVLLATHTAFEDRIQDEIRRLGLECRLVYNRGELMILPPGVSKGFGLSKALGELGISYHNTIAVGDAENDHSLLGACEFGAAVANAVEGLKRHADLVLEQADGDGVAALLDRLACGDDSSLVPALWRIQLGTSADGSPADMAASRVNLLITGRSKSGKSFAAGTIAERLIENGYSVCLIDPEGDYASLGKLHGVKCLGNVGHAPDVEEVRRFLAHRFGSVIVDLSLVETVRQAACTQALLRALAADRRLSGLPHWIIIDEAHHALGLPGELGQTLEEGPKGYCLVTYQPQVLERHLCTAMDHLLVMPGGRRLAGPDPISEVERITGLSLTTTLDGVDTGYALLVDLGGSREVRLIELAPRRTAHVRHWHKYVQGKLPLWLRFNFTGRDGRGVSSAANVQEFCDLVSETPPDTVAFHGERLDFSRWIREALQEEALAADVRSSEQRFIASNRASDDVVALRSAVVKAIMQHYG
jgi:hypothetical protein